MITKLDKNVLTTQKSIKLNLNTNQRNNFLIINLKT